MSLFVALMETAISQVAESVKSPYPPSFDNNPLTFGWALFARLTVLLMSIATLIRIASRNRIERIAANHPVYYHRMVTACFLWAATFSAASDVMTDLFWGEASGATLTVVFFTARILEGITIIPFLGALFVPLWLRWFCRIGFLSRAPSITLNGVVNDARVAWDSWQTPVKLLGYSAATALLVTSYKYWLWIEHGRP